jgi:1-acyl-sn-glycerol-3-phosphate acyltransferase
MPARYPPLPDTAVTALLAGDFAAPERASAVLPVETMTLPEIRAALRARMAGLGLAADLALAPIDNLFDDARSALRFARTPALYYANHQTSYESFVFAYLHAAISGVPLFVVTHPGLFDNDYGEHCALMAELLFKLDHPAANLVAVEPVPSELAAARRFLVGLPERLAGRSLLVHIEGWREMHEGQRIHLMSRDLMDVTLRLNRPVIPVRISGGLPGAPVGYKFHLPYRMGRIRYRMGEPIAPETLAALPSLAARRRILGAINAMAPDEGAYAGQANFALFKRCLRRHLQTGSSALKCFLIDAIERMPDPSAESVLLRSLIRTGVLPTQGVADAAWFARKAMWLTDGLGLKTVAEAGRG